MDLLSSKCLIRQFRFAQGHRVILGGRDFVPPYEEGEAQSPCPQVIIVPASIILTWGGRDGTSTNACTTSVDLQGCFQPVTQILKRHTTTSSSTTCDWLAVKVETRKLKALGSKETTKRSGGWGGGQHGPREPEGGPVSVRGVDEKLKIHFICNLHSQNPQTRRLCSFHHLSVLHVPSSKPPFGRQPGTRRK